MKRILLQGIIDKSLYKLLYKASAPNKLSSASFTALATSSIWHNHLAHALNAIVQKTLVMHNINVIKLSRSYAYDSCELSKFHKKPFPFEIHVTACSPFDILYLLFFLSSRP